MPNAIAQKWWDLADSKEKNLLKQKWETLPESYKNHIINHLNKKCESYDYPIPETNEEYCFYICYWPQCLEEILEKEITIEEEFITDWWNKDLSEKSKESLAQLLFKLDPNQQDLVNNKFDRTRKEKLFETSTSINCFYLCYFKELHFSAFNDLQQCIRKPTIKLINHKYGLFPLVTLNMVNSAQSYREALDRKGLTEISKEILKKFKIKSTVIMLVLVAFGICLFTFKQVYGSAKNLFHKKKPLRNLWYIASQAGGGYLGWFIGGLFVSSLFPVIGNLTYIVLAATIATVASLVRNLIAKSIAQSVSSLSVKCGYYGDEYIAYPPSPDKYRAAAKPDSLVFTKDEQKTMSSNRIAFMLGELKKEKDKKIGFSRHFSCTESSSVKKEFNQHIKQVRTGQVLPNIPYIGRFYTYIWESSCVNGEIKDALQIKPSLELRPG